MHFQGDSLPHGQLVPVAIAWRLQLLPTLGSPQCCLSILTVWQLAPTERVIQERKAEATVPSMTKPQKSHTITSAVIYWPHTLALIYCKKRLQKGVKMNAKIIVAIFFFFF